MDDELTNAFQKILGEELKKEELNDKKISRSVGDFLYYFNNIELIIEELILNSCPQLEYYLKNRNRIGFDDKFTLLKSFVDKHDEINIFQLIALLNKLRNKLAHSKYNDDMINEQEFNRLYDLSHSGAPVITDKEKEIEKSFKLALALRCVLVTSSTLRFILEIQKFCMIHDKELSSYKKMQDEGSLKSRISLTKLLLNNQQSLS